MRLTNWRHQQNQEGRAAIRAATKQAIPTGPVTPQEVRDLPLSVLGLLEMGLRSEEELHPDFSGGVESRHARQESPGGGHAALSTVGQNHLTPSGSSALPTENSFSPAGTDSLHGGCQPNTQNKAGGGTENSLPVHVQAEPNSKIGDGVSVTGNGEARESTTARAEKSAVGNSAGAERDGHFRGGQNLSEIDVACDGLGHVWDEVARRFFKTK
ncbi:MAG: hypothetical protein QOI07_891 [Verrucomicrobiota bacterium]|jgi:hypothetical protein